MNQSNRILVWFLWKSYPSWILFFAIAKPVLIPNLKKEVSTKDLLHKHKKCIAMHLSSLSPLAPSDPSNYFCFFVFNFFHFLIKLKLINLNWGNPHHLCSLLSKIIKKWQTMSAHGLVWADSTKNAVRSGGLAIHIHNETSTKK